MKRVASSEPSGDPRRQRIEEPCDFSAWFPQRGAAPRGIAPRNVPPLTCSRCAHIGPSAESCFARRHCLTRAWLPESGSDWSGGETYGAQAQAAFSPPLPPCESKEPAVTRTTAPAEIVHAFLPPGAGAQLPPPPPPALLSAALLQTPLSSMPPGGRSEGGGRATQMG